MTKNAFRALWAIVFLCFAVACDTAADERAALETAKLAEIVKRIAAKNEAASLAETNAPHPNRDNEPEQRSLSRDSAFRVAAEMVTAAALMDTTAGFPAVDGPNPVWVDNDPAVAETGLGLPILLWESDGRMSLDDAKRAFAALLARRSIDKIVRGAEPIDEMTAADRVAMVCEIAQVFPKAGSYVACIERVSSIGTTAQQRALADDAQRCADAVVVANMGAIDTVARQLQKPFALEEDGRFMRSLLGERSGEDMFASASIIPMRGEMTMDLPQFCVAPRARQSAATGGLGATATVIPLRIELRNAFVRLAAQLTTSALLQRNPASGCDGWSPGDSVGTAVVYSGDDKQLSYTSDLVKTDSRGCDAVALLAANAATLSYAGRDFVDATSYNAMASSAVSRRFYEQWPAKTMSGDRASWSTRQKQLWKRRDLHASVHFPSFQKYEAQMFWQKGVCATEITKINDALIAEYADALYAKFALSSTHTKLASGDERTLMLPIKDAIALMPRKPVFPGKMKVPPFCSAPEPKKLAKRK